MLVTCSHCHTVNVIDPDRVTPCSDCGHRADLSRLECDCPACTGGAKQEITAADAEAAKEWLAKRGAP